MSKDWSWILEDDLRVMEWAINSAKDCLAKGDSWTASVIFTGIGNLLALRSMLLKKSTRVNNWIWDTHYVIYEGTLNSELELIYRDHPVVKRLSLLNQFFELNDLGATKMVVANAPDLIIPEPYEDYGITE